MTLPSLYVIAAEYQSAVARLADLDLDEQTFADTLESLSGDLENKSVNAAMFVKSLEATAASIKIAEGQMEARRKAIEARAARVLEYIKDNMIACGISKIECPYFRLSIRDNPASVVIDSPNLIPDDYMRQAEAPPPAPDKKAIAEAIKAGVEVHGAHLQYGQRLEIK